MIDGCSTKEIRGPMAGQCPQRCCTGVRLPQRLAGGRLSVAAAQGLVGVGEHRADEDRREGVCLHGRSSGDRSHPVYRTLSPKRLDPSTARGSDVTPRRSVATTPPLPVPIPIPPTLPPAVDQDADGRPATVDCHGVDATVRPGAADRPGDGVDQDFFQCRHGAGDSEVRANLYWDDVADLDLQVSEPDATVIVWASPSPTTGRHTRPCAWQPPESYDPLVQQGGVPGRSPLVIRKYA